MNLHGDLIIKGEDMQILISHLLKNGYSVNAMPNDENSVRLIITRSEDNGI